MPPPRRSRWPLAALAVLLPAVAAAADPPAAAITVQAARPGPRLDPGLYGIFFEEINHAGDGGLYAELIRNRSFEDTVPPEGTTLAGREVVGNDSPHYQTGQPRRWRHPWKFDSDTPGWTLDAAPGAASMTLEKADPLNAAQQRYLRLQAADRPAGAKAPRLVNSGYWGIHAEKGKVYRLSFFARIPAGKDAAPIRAGLLAPDGSLLAEGSLSAPADGRWHKLSIELKPTATSPQARFFLEPAPGTLDLDVVSLFPVDTYKGRPNGLRVDLMQKLLDLKPAFLRFPGGCYVEGCTYPNRYRWKETLGPIEERPGHWCLWGYRSTDGLGYHEYLQLCEDLGAAAMYVTNCGLSCEGRNGDFLPDDRLQEQIQDTLDAIEYAVGPPTSRWGQARAAAGHPEPFHLKYLEIGNENHGPAYESRYRRFYLAIKERYPKLILIANAGVKSATIEMRDDHYYNNPDWFRANVGLYDRMDRKGPPVYVGEVACNSGVGKGNLLAGLADAAFLLGLERNGDLVKMISYAPLFFNVHDRAWPVNQIGFDSARSFGTPAFHVYKAFAATQGTHTLPVQVVSPSDQPRHVLDRGAVALGTWNTRAEFKDLVVSAGDKELARPDLSRFRETGKVLKGDWSFADGALRQTSDDDFTRVRFGDPAWTDYTLKVKARKIAGSEGFILYVRQATDRDFLSLNLGGWQNQRTAIERGLGGRKQTIAAHDQGYRPIETGRWYDIEIRVRGDRMTCLLDDRVIIDAPHATRDTARDLLVAGAQRDDKTGAVVLKAVNFSETPLRPQVTLDGAADLSPEADQWTMTSARLTDENTVEEPERATFVKSRRTVVGPRFAWDLPPRSVTVLRLLPRAAANP